MSSEKQPKVIKRYANRKLYDTERSCYVTLEEIAVMIKDGEDLQVVDNKTKDDLTAVTLAQIIVEEEKKVAKMPLKLLRGIIQSSNDAFEGLQKRVLDPVQSLRDDVERRVDGLLRRGERKDELTDEQDGAADSADTENGEQDDVRRPRVVREFVSSTQEALESWQRRIDDRVKEALTKMTHLTHVGADVAQLRERISQLEQQLEQARKTES
ncbi:MAG: polyhydroxyalkanoate synthesis regulator DNA-binding domain-containing protein [Myxococcota bacterium]